MKSETRGKSQSSKMFKKLKLVWFESCVQVNFLWQKMCRNTSDINVADCDNMFISTSISLPISPHGGILRNVGF